MSITNRQGINIVSSTVDPDSGDDFASGYGIFSWWYNATGDKVWICVADGEWKQVGGGNGYSPPASAGGNLDATWASGSVTRNDGGSFVTDGFTASMELRAYSCQNSSNDTNKLAIDSVTASAINFTSHGTTDSNDDDCKLEGWNHIGRGLNISVSFEATGSKIVRGAGRFNGWDVAPYNFAVGDYMAIENAVDAANNFVPQVDQVKIASIGDPDVLTFTVDGSVEDETDDVVSLWAYR